MSQQNQSKTALGNALPICPYERACGGCTLQRVPYDKQLEDKQKYIRQLLDEYCKIEPIIGMNFPYYYRNKVHGTFAYGKQRKIVCGIYEENTHFVVDIEDCQLQNKKSNEIIRDIKKLFGDIHVIPYDEDMGTGIARHVLIRQGFATGEIMVVLVLATPIFPAKKNFVAALTAKHPEIKTIIINVNEKQTSMVLGDREIVIFGKGYIEDELLGMRFRISAKSFYQVNGLQTKKLYRKALEYASLTKDDEVLDAYCGTGTIGLLASKEAGHVTGVELNSDAIADAIKNAKENGVRNIYFENVDAGEYMRERARRGEKIDVVFMDPPRAGSDETFLASLINLKPKKVVYVSCNPQTLARDIKILVKGKYHVEKIQPVDMFPFTGHVETIVALHRTSS